MRGEYTRGSDAHIEARFRTSISKRDAKKTGLLLDTSNTYFRCTRIGCYGIVTSTKRPESCPHDHPNVLLEKKCNGPMVKVTVVEVEAMPIGRIIIDMRRVGW